MRTKQDFERDWCCPKCRARGPAVNEVAIVRSLARFVPLSPDTHLAVTCSLCGFTELYSQTVLARSEKTVPNHGKLVEKTDET